MKNRARGITPVCVAAAITLLTAAPGAGAADARRAGTPEPYRAASLEPGGSAARIEPGYRIVDHDIMVPLDAVITDGQVAPDATFEVRQWLDGVVPYAFDPSVAANDASCDGGSCEQLMLDAMQIWESVANVDFRPWTISDPNYLLIQNAATNASFVGMIGGLQVMQIFRWNSPYTIVHELGHALGFWHEQSRIDRDTYVQVNCENTTAGCCSGATCGVNFRIEDTSLNYGPYDFESVMHYGQCFLSTCGMLECPFPVTQDCVTITVLPPNDYIAGSGTCDTGASVCDSGRLIGRPCLGDQDCQLWQHAIGQRDHLSRSDRLTMSFLYPEDDWVFVDASYGSGPKDGGFLTPYRTLADGVAATPPGGTLWVQPGTYTAAGTYSASITIRAPLGGVILHR